MTTRDKYAMYALAIGAGVGIAVWTGVQWTFLLFLICPVMMFFMMRGMGGLSGTQRGDGSSSGRDAAAKRSDATPPDGSYERIN